jgi:cytochrome c-type biogenesis protein CcmH/NrfG
MPPNSEIEKLERVGRRIPRNRVRALCGSSPQERRSPRGRDVLRQGLELHPDHIPGNIVLGRCCLDLREDGPAEAAFIHVLDLDSENVIALKALADITERQGRLMERAPG